MLRSRSNATRHKVTIYAIALKRHLFTFACFVFCVCACLCLCAWYQPQIVHRITPISFSSKSQSHNKHMYDVCTVQLYICNASSPILTNSFENKIRMQGLLYAHGITQSLGYRHRARWFFWFCSLANCAGSVHITLFAAEIIWCIRQ